MKIDTLETIKLNAKTGRFLFILDTINELTNEQIKEAIGDNFRLLRVSLIDEAKQIIVHLNKEVTDDKLNDICVIINRPDMLRTPESLKKSHGLNVPRYGYRVDTCEPVVIDPKQPTDSYIFVDPKDWPKYKDFIDTLLRIGTRLNMIILRGVPYALCQQIQMASPEQSRR